MQRWRDVADRTAGYLPRLKGVAGAGCALICASDFFWFFSAKACFFFRSVDFGDLSPMDPAFAGVNEESRDQLEPYHHSKVRPVNPARPRVPPRRWRDALFTRAPRTPRGL